MKKQEFIQIVQTLIEGDVIIVEIRPHNFLPQRENSFPPLAHCVFVKANREFIQVSFEGTINPNGELINGKLPEQINYARIQRIEKINPSRLV